MPHMAETPDSRLFIAILLYERCSHIGRHLFESHRADAALGRR
jgi:hypothetical protein